MIDQLDELYRDVILEHYRNSAHAGALPGAQITAEGNNPLCGDELAFHLQLEGGRVVRARFVAKGCAISQAAASMLAQEIEGKSRAQIAELITGLRALMQGQNVQGVELGDLESLAGVRKFPVRVKCAALSWNVVENGLQGQTRGTTTETTR